MNLRKQFIFTKKLESLYKSGKPLTETFELLSRNEPNKDLRNIFTDIASEIKSGSSLSAALEKNDILDEAYSRLIHVGEVSGRLDIVLGHILELQGSLMNIRKKIIGASIYPVVLLSVYALLLFIILFILVPTLVGFMSKFNADVPPLLLIVSEVQRFIFFPSTLIALPMFILLCFLMLYIYLNIDSLSKLRGRLLLFIPGFGRLDRLKNMYAFIFTMKVCYESGLSALESSELSVHSVNNSYLFDLFADVYRDIKNGDNISRALMKTQLFNYDMIDLISVGEETGKLEESYKEVVKLIDEKINITIAVMIAMIKPMGVLLGLLCLGGIFAGVISILVSAFSRIKNVLPH